MAVIVVFGILTPLGSEARSPYLLADEPAADTCSSSKGHQFNTGAVGQFAMLPVTFTSPAQLPSRMLSVASMSSSTGRSKRRLCNTRRKLDRGAGSPARARRPHRRN